MIRKTEAATKHGASKQESFAFRRESFNKPRGTIYQHSPSLNAFNGCILAACGFFLFLPLPPGTNFLPGLAAFLLALGILEKDLGVMIAAYVVFLLNCALMLLPFFLLQLDYSPLQMK